MKKGIWQCRIPEFRRSTSASDREAGRIEDTDLHQNICLVPHDVLVGNLTFAYSDNHHEDHFDVLARGLDAGEHPIDRGGMGE